MLSGPTFSVSSAAGQQKALFTFDLHNLESRRVELKLRGIRLPTGLRLLSAGLPEIASIPAKGSATLSLGVGVANCAASPSAGRVWVDARRAGESRWQLLNVTVRDVGTHVSWKAAIIQSACGQSAVQAARP